MLTFKKFIRETSEKPYPNVLFHFTNIFNMADILKNGKIEMSTGVGTGADRDERSNGKPFFLSLSRNPVNDYSEAQSYKTGVLIALDKDYLQSRNKIVPRDYWERMWLASHGKNSATTRTSEQEERVWSHNPYIEIPKDASRLIKAIHVLNDPSADSDFHDATSEQVRTILLQAKKRGIPVHYYDNQRDFLTTNQLKRKKIKDIISNLKGSAPSRRGYKRTDWLKGWRELVHKRRKEKLSDLGDRMRQKVMYYDYEAPTSLESDIHNAVKSSNRYQKVTAYKTIQDMERFGSIDTKKFIQLLKKKWSDIEDNPCKHPWDRAKDKSRCGKRASK